MPSLVIPCFRILGSAVGGRCLFSSTFEYANLVEKCCADIGAPGTNLLAAAAVLRRDNSKFLEWHL